MYPQVHFENCIEEHNFSHRFGDRGGVHIAAALRNNKTLVRLDLLGNQFGSNTASKLSQALPENSTLTSINLMKNMFNNEDGAILEAALKKNQTILEFLIQDNPIDVGLISRISRVSNVPLF